jgi:hypothetical protein
MTTPTPTARHLPAALAMSGGLLLVAAVVGGLAAGAPGAAGAAAGVGLVAAANLFSTLAVARAEAVARPLIMPMGLMAYVVKLTVIGGVMWLAAVAGWPGLVPMAWGIVAGVVGWAAITVWVQARRGPAHPS